jgi:hypothetical protein
LVASLEHTVDRLDQSGRLGLFVPFLLRAWKQKYLDPVLEATQIRGTEDDEDGVTLPVDLPESLALNLPRTRCLQLGRK